MLKVLLLLFILKNINLLSVLLNNSNFIYKVGIYSYRLVKYSIKLFLLPKDNGTSEEWIIIDN